MPQGEYASDPSLEYSGAVAVVSAIVRSARSTSATSRAVQLVAVIPFNAASRRLDSISFVFDMFVQVK